LAATPLSHKRVRGDNEEELSAEGNGICDIVVEPATQRCGLSDNAPPVLLHDQVHGTGGVSYLRRLLGVNGRAAGLGDLPQPANQNIFFQQIGYHIASDCGDGEVQCRRVSPARNSWI